MNICFCYAPSQNFPHFSFFPPFPLISLMPFMEEPSAPLTATPPPHVLHPHPHPHPHTHTHTPTHTHTHVFPFYETDLKENHISLPPVGNYPFKYHLKIFVCPPTAAFMTSHGIMDAAACLGGQDFLLCREMEPRR